MSTEERQEVLARVAGGGRALSDAVILYHEALAARVGLSPSQWKVLGLLEQGRALGAGELAAATGLAPASITGILDRLQEKGYVVRTPDPSDRRRTVIELNRDGIQGLYSTFDDLMHRLAALHADYSTKELSVIADYLSRAAEAQREATRHLEDRSPGGGE